MSTAPPDTFLVRWGSASHPGRIRASNEDDFLAHRPVFVVADGMGGHSRGELASATAISAFAPLVGRPWATADDVVVAVENASQGVRDLSTGLPAAPGSTLTGVAITNQAGLPCWLVFNVGDSRAYLLSGGVLSQVSVDHSAEVAVAGGTAGSRGVITRALGAGMVRPALADQWLIPAATGDRVLLCSDGLTKEVTEQLMTAVLLSEADPQTAAQLLVESALDAGGRDNVTVVLVEAVSVRGGPDVDSGPTLGDGDPSTESDRTLPDAEAESSEPDGWR